MHLADLVSTTRNNSHFIQNFLNERTEINERQQLKPKNKYTHTAKKCSFIFTANHKLKQELIKGYDFTQV